MEHQPQTARADTRVSRAPDRPASGAGTAASAHPVLALQRRVGNQAAARIVQAKLRVGPPGDVYEQEADRVADDVMRMPAGGPVAGVQRQAIRAVQAKCADCEREERETARTLQRVPAAATDDGPDAEREEEPAAAVAQREEREESDEEKAQPARLAQREERGEPEEEPGTAVAQRQEREDADEELAQPARLAQREERAPEKEDEDEAVPPRLQASAARAVPAVSPQVESRIGGARGAGYALPPGSRDFFESRLGADFSGVRVHTDSLAAGTSRELGARAFTVGPDIFFGEGEFRPESAAGRRLLAHELTHVVQQGAPGAAAGRTLQRQAAADTRSPVRDAATGTGTVLEVEGLLRTLYGRADEAVFQEAQFMLQNGVSRQSVAQWVVEARNRAKVAIRRWDLDVVRLLAEQRNRRRYGHPVGPSYGQLSTGDPARNIPPHTDAEIIDAARRPNQGVNRWAGRLRIAGRILILVDIGFAAYHVASAPEVDRPRELMRQVGGIAGAAAGGWAGAKLGGMAGAAVGAWFGGAGAIPGAAIGAIIGGIGGAIGGGWAGQQAGDLLADQFYPPAQTRFEGSLQ